MPSYPHIERYRAELAQLVAAGGSARELNIRPAFQNCLAAYCAGHREGLTLVPELRTPGGVIPDGTVKDTLRMARGYWEAKDSGDNLDAEIARKFRRGYPRDNILFEDSRTAVLVQNGGEAMRADMSRPGDLHRLIRRFLDYELPAIGEFRQARQQFRDDLPAVLDNLRAAVSDAETDNPGYQAAAAGFLALCRRTISPEVSGDDVREMLLQHILTRDIFLRVFAEDQFHRDNNIAAQLDALERTFFTGDVRRQAIARLLTYYGAIGRAADAIADYGEKQQFLKAFYEDFYRAYNPAAADRLGVVYTPNEIVDFIIRGADVLLQRHFGRRLADDRVRILDPAAGTGTFITGLINYLPAERLEYKYRHEIHANEVAILPYYIANLNIEYSYRERAGQYVEFPNLCFVDTLDNMDWQEAGASGGAVSRQASFNLGALSEENWIRVQEQNEKPISVIIGNPPYNATQRYWNDFNPNRAYPEIDRRIRATYAQASAARNKHKQYDMYKRFLRWASDRLDDEGIIAFVSNSGFLDGRQDDGFRKVVSGEFCELWVIDLKGNARTSGERRRQEGGNIFEDKIRVGVAIYFLVRNRQRAGFKVFYNAVGDYAKSAAKAEYIRGKTMRDFDFEEIAPDADGQWLEQSVNRLKFRRLMPLAERAPAGGAAGGAGDADAGGDAPAVFRRHAPGIVTARDEWVYDFDADNLKSKTRFFADTYNRLRDAGDESYDPVIKWSRNLKRHFQAGRRIEYDEGKVIPALYRPFVTKWYFADAVMSNDLTRNHYEMFGPDLQQPNKVICFSGVASVKPFQVLATDKLPGFDTLEKTQCLPLYRYTAEGERVSNISARAVSEINRQRLADWGERDYRRVFGAAGITAEDIFAYIYGILHDRGYRREYGIDLRREFPRLPLYHDFEVWRAAGGALLECHLGFETAAPYELERREKAAAPADGGRPILRADRERGLLLIDQWTTLAGVPAAAWQYRLGSRTALEWALEQYRERKPRDPTIAERFNGYRFADYKETAIDLLRRVCTVSARTAGIMDGLAYWLDAELLVENGDRGTDQLPPPERLLAPYLRDGEGELTGLTGLTGLTAADAEAPA